MATIDRKTIIGASDVPAICGISPWQSCYDIWAEKVGIVEPREESIAMSLGKILEPALIKYVSENICKVAEVQKVFQYDKFDLLPLQCTVDAYLDDGNIAEVKTSGLVGPKNPGKEWTNEGIPDYVWLQVQTQLFLTKAKTCHVVALVGGLGIMQYSIEKKEAFEEYVIPILTEFWNCVKNRIPPEDSRPSIDTIKKITSDGDLVLEVDEDTKEYEIARRLLELSNQKKTLSEELSEIESEMDKLYCVLFGPRPNFSKFIANAVGGKIEVYKTQYNRSDLDVKSLKKELPEIYERFKITRTVSRFGVRVIDLQKG
ncbi:MAG: hypothetical protein KatS3mg087_1058 [Patescibacteria group bacterium]|nr:MAG: hypothetical protein KatS3mg087_1058 [Patescibacteria group bacterium]